MRKLGTIRVLGRTEEEIQQDILDAVHAAEPEDALRADRLLLAVMSDYEAANGIASMRERLSRWFDVED
jgi:hypothetical protein